MVAGSSTVAVGATIEGGLRRWLRSYLMMMRFDVRGLGQWLALGVIIQVLMGAGMAIMYGSISVRCPSRPRCSWQRAFRPSPSSRSGS